MVMIRELGIIIKNLNNNLKNNIISVLSDAFVMKY